MRLAINMVANEAHPISSTAVVMEKKNTECGTSVLRMAALAPGGFLATDAS